jgi:Flp pilus assembly protein TadG
MKAERGQSLVEMALTLPILLLILCGLIDLGRLYFTYVALEDIAGEAALYLSINPGCRYKTDLPDPINPTKCDDPNNATYRAQHAAGQEVDWSRVTLELVVPSTAGVGEPVKVAVHYTFDLITPLLPRVVGMSQVKVTTRATQIIISK